MRRGVIWHVVSAALASCSTQPVPYQRAGKDMTCSRLSVRQIAFQSILIVETHDDHLRISRPFVHITSDGAKMTKARIELATFSDFAHSVTVNEM